MGRSESKSLSIPLGTDANAGKSGDEELRNRLKSLRVICLYRSELVITSMWEQEPFDVVIGELGTEIRPQYTMSRVVQSHVTVERSETRGVAGFEGQSGHIRGRPGSRLSLKPLVKGGFRPLMPQFGRKVCIQVVMFGIFNLSMRKIGEKHLNGAIITTRRVKIHRTKEPFAHSDVF